MCLCIYVIFYSPTSGSKRYVEIRIRVLMSSQNIFDGFCDLILTQVNGMLRSVGRITYPEGAHCIARLITVVSSTAKQNDRGWPAAGRRPLVSHAQSQQASLQCNRCTLARRLDVFRRANFHRDCRAISGSAAPSRFRHLSPPTSCIHPTAVRLQQ